MDKHKDSSLLSGRDGGEWGKTQKIRRHFLKKALYTAPTLFAMGQLAKPKAVLGASDDFNGPGGSPGGGTLPPTP